MTKELRLAKELVEGVERILCASKGHHLSTSKAVVTTVTKIKFPTVRSELLLHPRPRRIIGNAFALCLVSQKLRLLQTQCGNKALCVLEGGGRSQLRALHLPQPRQQVTGKFAQQVVVGLVLLGALHSIQQGITSRRPW